MNKAKEISVLWKQIKPQIGELARLCHEVESHYEVTADAYQRGYETAKQECEDCPKQAYTDALKMEAYQQGLNDLWEAMQKAIKMYCEIDNEVFLRVFHDVKCDWGESVLQALFKNTPQHLIDSIREYEQKQKCNPYEECIMGYISDLCERHDLPFEELADVIDRMRRGDQK